MAPRAVFLSYAREDTDAARRVADALRAFGVEVWFDQNELRGGDTWDAKIKKQIRECALFLPLVSQHTQERSEGYFRREWLLAVERTRDMHTGVAFVVPVVIDETREADAAVPEEFMRYQWTRLAHGVPSPQFVEQIKRLLEAPRNAATATRPAVGGSASSAAAPRLSGFTAWLAGAVGIAVLGAVVYFALRPTAKEPPATPPKPAAEIKTAAYPSAPTVRQAGEKSIAVLAFANFGGDKENEYFSDGITEELLNVLAKVPGLRVAARTSAFYFKDKNVPIPEIAQKLNVAYIVEGSVQRSGTRVKITAQLISAADGFHLWSDTFTRELKDIFAMQDEIAGVIAQNLQLKLDAAPRTAKAVDPEAYRLVLEGRYFWNLRTYEGFNRAEAAFTRAVAISPQFAQAHAGLASVDVLRENFRALDGFASSEAGIRRAREEAGRAIELDPSFTDSHAIQAFALLLDGKLPDAARRFQEALAINPNAALNHSWYGYLLLCRGQIDAALREYKQSAELDPLAFMNLYLLAVGLTNARRFAEAVEINERAAALRTDLFIPIQGLRVTLLLATGQPGEAVEAARLMRRKLAEQPRYYTDSYAIAALKQAGPPSEAEDYAVQFIAALPSGSYLRGFVLAALGRFDEALPYLEQTPVNARTQLFWNPQWDPWRDDPRFQQLMVKLGCVEEYKLARETLARMLKEQTANK